MAAHGTHSYETDVLRCEAISFFIELAIWHDHVKAREKAVEEIKKSTELYQKKWATKRCIFAFEVRKLFFLIDLGKLKFVVICQAQPFSLGRLQEAQETIDKLAIFGDAQQVDSPTIPDVPLVQYLNFARLCLILIQWHEVGQNTASYETFKSLLESHTCLPTDPVAKLRSTDMAMEGIKRFVLGFEKRFLEEKLHSLLKKLWRFFSMLIQTSEEVGYKTFDFEIEGVAYLREMLLP